MIYPSKSSSYTINNNIIEEVDRISGLPDALIHHILSFVDTIDAVQTCVLSMRWIHIWKSLPFLNFEIYGYGCGRFVNTLKMVDVYDKVLLLRDDDCSIQRFKLTWDSHGVSISSVNRWVDAAVNHKVEEVTIELSQYAQYLTYETSPRLLNCRSLKKLTLRVCCDYGLPYTDVILPKSMSLPQLQFMCLDGFLVYDVELSKKLFSSCPVLETVHVVNCDIKTDNQGNFILESLSLKQFAYIYWHGSGGSLYYRKPKLIRLSTPNLGKFICESNWKHEYDLQNCSDLLSDVKLNILYSYEYENEQPEDKQVYARWLVKLLVRVDKVKRLQLSTGFLEVLSKATDLVNCVLPCLCNLQSLKLEMWFTRDSLRAIAYLLTISPNIKTLILIPNPNGITWNKMQQRCPYKRDLHESKLADIGNDWDVGFSLPGMLSHLKVVRIQNAEGCYAELNILSFVLKNAKGLEEVAIYPCSTVNSIHRNRLTKKYKDKLRAHRKSLSAHQNKVGSNIKYPNVHIVN